MICNTKEKGERESDPIHSDPVLLVQEIQDVRKKEKDRRERETYSTSSQSSSEEEANKDGDEWMIDWRR